jgi:hypothetical protein
MQITMQSILGFAPFYETVKSQKLPMKTAYRLAQLAKAVDSELQFYREKMQSIVAEYGEKDEDGHPISTEDGNGIKLRAGTEALCFNAIRELQELEVNLPDITFSIEDFGAIELSAEEMTVILPFIAD